MIAIIGFVLVMCLIVVSLLALALTIADLVPPIIAIALVLLPSLIIFSQLI